MMKLGLLLNIAAAFMGMAAPVLSQTNNGQPRPLIVPTQPNIVPVQPTILPVQPSIVPIEPSESQPQPTIIPGTPSKEQPGYELPQIFPCSAPLCEVPLTLV